MRVLLVLVVTSALSQACWAGPVLDCVRARGSRNIWIPLSDGAAIHRLADAGFNTATAATWLLTEAESSAGPDDPFILRETDIPGARLALIRQQARACAERGLLYLPYINQMADHEVRLLQGKGYRRVINHRGREYRVAPCPLERKDWFGFQLPQMLAIARVLQEEGCEGGVMLEAEAYCSDIYPGYHTQRQELCYCDHCFAQFVDSLPAGLRPRQALAAPERYPWLSAQGLLWDWEQRQQRALAGLLREFAAEVRKVKPDCVFGLYPYAIHWYSDAIVEGLGTAELPVLVYSASEYYSGYNVTPGWTWCSNYSSREHIRHIAQAGLPALYLGGLSVGTYWPRRMGLEMARLAREGDGSWLYWGGTLLTDDANARIDPAGSSEFVSREKPSAYWPVLGEANRAITSDVSDRGAPNRGTVTAWRALRLAGPEDEPRTWDASRPPRHRDGWEATGMWSAVDTSRRALLFDVGAQTRRPRALRLDYTFTQAAETEYLFGVEVLYEGPPVGARVNMGYSYPGYVEDDGRQIYQFTNRLLRPEDSWQTWWLPVAAQKEARQAWLRLQVHPNPGRVWVRRLIVAPARTHEIESEVVALPQGRAWGRLDWRCEPAQGAVCSIDVYDAQNGEQLLGGVQNGETLADLTRIYAVEAIRLKARVTVPAGETVALSASVGTR